jgi:hypothetical protein
LDGLIINVFLFYNYFIWLCSFLWTVSVICLQFIIDLFYILGLSLQDLLKLNKRMNEPFKRLEILPIPCVYLLSLMTFVVNNYNKFLTTKSIYTFGTRSNDHLHIPASRLLSYQRGAYYSGAQLFNILPTSITTLKNDKRRFRLVLRKYLQVMCKGWA